MAATDSPRSPSIRHDATYLITGGTGALALSVAEWLIAEGARHLALVARRDPSPEAASAIARLRQAGAEVVTVNADVARADDVDSVIAQISARMPALRGVIHAAGTLDDGVLIQQTWQRFEAVLAPKVAGGWHLYRATAGFPLDFFVLFSSMVPLFGAPGQGSYAAANA